MAIITRFLDTVHRMVFSPRRARGQHIRMLVLATIAGLVGVVWLDKQYRWDNMPLLANALSGLLMLPAGFLATLVVLETLLDREKRHSRSAFLNPLGNVVGDHAIRTTEAIRGRYVNTSYAYVRGTLVEDCRELYEVLAAGCPYKFENKGSVFEAPSPNAIPNRFPSQPFHRQKYGKLSVVLYRLATSETPQQELSNAKNELDQIIGIANQSLAIYYDGDLAALSAATSERFTSLRQAVEATNQSLAESFARRIESWMNEVRVPVPETVEDVMSGPLWIPTDWLNEVVEAIWAVLTELTAAIRFGEALADLCRAIERARKAGSES